MLPDRRKKVAALLTSPVAGERQAARAALDRIQPVAPPLPGTVEWNEGRKEWWRKIQFCVARLGSPILNRSEIITIRNWERGVGDPWARGADTLLDVYRKLMAAEPSR